MRHLLLVLLLALITGACGGGEGATSATGLVDSIPAANTIPGADGDTVTKVGDSVQVHYVGTLDDGSQFDSSRERGQTLDFVIGAPGLIAGFDAGVRGMKVGEIKTVRIEPAEAYGEVNPDLLQTVDLAQLPEGLKVGDPLTTSTGQQVVVVELTEDTAVLDFNHSLAGQTLTFELEMVAINP